MANGNAEGRVQQLEIQVAKLTKEMYWVHAELAAVKERLAPSDNTIVVDQTIVLDPSDDPKVT